MVFVIRYSWVGEFVLPREDERFPGRTLLPLPIGGEAVYVAIQALKLVAEGHPSSVRQTVSETACSEGYIWGPPHCWVSCQMRTVFMERLQVFIGQLPLCPQRSIERACCVTLGEDEHILGSHNLVMQN